MKAKEVKEKENKVKEVEKEPEEDSTEEETLEDLFEEEFREERNFEEGTSKEKEDDQIETEEVLVHNPPAVLLEEVVADAPVISQPERQGDFYKTSASSGDFYGGKNPNDIYSGTSDTYNSSGNGNYLANGEGQSSNGNFYNLVNGEQERVGEIRGARGSRLEIEGVRGASSSEKDKRKEDKYTAREY